MRKVLLITVVLLCFLSVSFVSAKTVTITSSDMIGGVVLGYGTNNNTHYGWPSWIGKGSWGAEIDGYWGYQTYTLPADISGATINSAYLQIYPTLLYGSLSNFTIYRNTGPGANNSVTYNTRPTSSPNITASYIINYSRDYSWNNISLLNDVQYWANGNPNYGWFFKTNDTYEDGIQIGLSGYRERLYIDYTPSMTITQPTTSQIFTQDSPTAIFNITAMNMSQCKYTIDSGVTNYTMTKTNITTVAGICYQETANVSTACGGSSGGNYVLTSSTGIAAWTTPEDAYDGDWTPASGAFCSAASCKFLVNYTIPAAANSAIWQLKDAFSVWTNITFNSTIVGPEGDYSACWNSNGGILSLRYDPSLYDWYCWNSTGWKLLRDTGGSAYGIYEEAIYWNVSDSYNEYWGGINTTMTDGNKNVTFYCNKSSDGTWVTSDTVPFLVDSQNITVCRNLTVSRTYNLMNNLEGGTNNCLTILNNGTVLNGNFKMINTTGRSIISIGNNTQIWNITLKTGIGLDSDYSATGNENGPFELYGFVYNSNLSGSSHAFLLADSSYKIYNTTFNGWTLSRTISPGFGSYLYQYWYFNSKINSSVENLQNANVTIRDKNNAIVYSGLTDSNGLISQQNILDYHAWNNATSSSDIFYSTFNVTVTKSGYNSNTTTLNLTALTNYNHLVTLTTVLNVSIKYPVNLSYINYNSSIGLNFTINNATATSCLYTVNNFATNTTITNCANTTFNLANGNYLLKLWANDTTGQVTESTVNFTVDTLYPTIDYGTNTAIDQANLSQNFVYINTTWTETNFQNITFNLYNSSGYLWSTDFNPTPTYFKNFTSLANRVYYYNVTICDKVNYCNTTPTRKITLDTNSPTATPNTPYSGYYTNVSSTNFTTNLTDNLGIKNATLSIYNQSNTLVNQTTVNYAPGVITTTVGVVVTLVENIYTWFYQIFDWAGNSVLSTNSTLNVDLINISYCHEINSPGYYYLDTNIIATESCFEIKSPDVTFDCQNKYIQGSGSTNTDSAIFSTGVNVTNLKILNCNITNFRYGIDLNGADNVNITNFISVGNSENTYYGINIIGNSKNAYINNVTISNSAVSNFYGIYLQNVNSSILNDIKINSNTGTTTVQGIVLKNTDSITVKNSNIGTSTTKEISLQGAKNTIIRDTAITSQIEITQTTQNPTNNTLLNTTESGRTIAAVGDNQYIKQWYLDINVTDTANNLIDLAPVNLYDVNWTLVDSFVTYLGIVPTQIVTQEYANGSIIYSLTPHHINATATGYFQNTTQITLNQNIKATVVLSLIDATAPTVNITYPTTTNYSAVTSINYTATDNIAVDKCWYSLNGGTNSTPQACTNFTGLTPKEGNNIWTVYANDTSGYIGSASVSFYYDSPTISYCRDLVMPNVVHTLNQSISTTSTCINIFANNITINLNGKTLDGDDTGTDYGINNQGYNSITISNGTLTDFYLGIRFLSTNNNTLTNIIANSNTKGGIQMNSYSDWGNGNTLRNITVNDPYLIGANIGYCVIAVGDNLILDTISANNCTYGLYTIGNNNSIDYLTLTNNTRGLYLGPLNYGNTTITNPYISQSTGYNIFDDSLGLDTLIYNNSFGKIEWISNTFKTNLDTQASEGSMILGSTIIIGNNSAYVSSSFSATGLNSAANVTLYNIGNRGFIFPAILEDGQNCLNCYNFTSLTASTVIFNVTGFSNYSIGEDSRFPRLTLISPTNKVYANGTVNLNYTASDENLDSCFYSDNGAANQTITCGTNTTITHTDGTYTLTMYANDTQGHVNSTTVTYYISTTNPAITLDYPADNSYLNYSNIQFNATATNANGIDTCELWGNWSGWHLNQTQTGLTSAVQFNFSSISLVEGNYIWNVWCNNSLGNGGFSPVNQTFTIDTLFPQITFGTGTESNGVNLSQSNVYINTTWTETNFQNITFNLYNSSGYLWSTDFNPTPTYFKNFDSLSDRVYYYNVTLCDKANNCNTTSTRKITLDITSPNATLLTPADSTITNVSAQNLTVNLTDNLGIKNSSLYLNGILNYTFTFASDIVTSTVGVVVTLSEGIYNWFYDVFDWAGNSYTTSNNTVTIVLSNPTINITSPLAQQYDTNSITLNVSATHLAPLNYWYSLNGGVNTSFTNPTTISASGGTNTLIAFINDSFGYSNTSSVTFTVRYTNSISTTLSVSPTTEIGANISIRANVTTDNTLVDECNFTLASPSGNVFVNQKGTESGGLWISPYHQILLAGNYSYNATCINEFGYKSYASGQFNVSDYALTLTSPTNPYYFAARLSATEQNNITVSIYDNVNTIINYNISVNIDTPANFTLTYPNTTVLNSTDTSSNPASFTINLQGNTGIAVGVFYRGNISLTNNLLGTVTFINFTYGIQPPSGIPEWRYYSGGFPLTCEGSTVGCAVTIPSIQQDSSTTYTRTMFNIGNYSLYNCSLEFAQQLKGNNWITFNPNIFDTSISAGKTITFTVAPTTSVSATTYEDNVFIICNQSDALGSITTSKNYLHFNIQVTSKPGPGGGGGGSEGPIIPPVANATQIAGLCGNNICEDGLDGRANFGENYANCQADCKGNLRPVVDCFNWFKGEDTGQCILKGTAFIWIIGFIGLILALTLFLERKRNSGPSTVPQFFTIKPRKRR